MAVLKVALPSYFHSPIRRFAFVSKQQTPDLVMAIAQPLRTPSWSYTCIRISPAPAVVLQPLFCMRAAYPDISYPVRKNLEYVKKIKKKWFQRFQWMAAGGSYLLAI